MTHRRNGSNTSEANDCAASDMDEKLGFQSRSDFTLEAFTKYAEGFKERYFGIKQGSESLDSCNYENGNGWQPSVEEIEGEYWRIVEKPTEEVEVITQYGSAGQFYVYLPYTNLSKKFINRYFTVLI
ncbi:uncharacterized protein A4U43_C03F5900 [Asparagus officinalis]|uniref:Uncharacterized protein n=1 Tax=Asparagus officinalis TaxID=4686 RepID=A0A5P1FAG3_ASPOF|nr:uncharacterized protein A4U43_C03F5900 [Asparagus officinalis]